jgi:hypothetical protein
MAPSIRGNIVLSKVLGNRSLVLHVPNHKTVLFNTDIRTLFEIGSQEATAEEIQGLSELLRVPEPAA